MLRDYVFYMAYNRHGELEKFGQVMLKLYKASVCTDLAKL